MKKGLVKKGVIAMAVALTLTFAIIAFAACGGAPSWARNAESPQAFRTAAVADGWTVLTATGDATGGSAVAMRSSHEFSFENPDEEIELNDNTTVWVETIVVIWFADETAAIAAYDATRTGHETQMANVPSGVRVRYSVDRNENTIITWGRMQGNWSIIRDITAGEED